MLQRLCKTRDVDDVELYLNSIKEKESEIKVSYILNLKNEQKYTALHTAIFSRFDSCKICHFYIQLLIFLN